MDKYKELYDLAREAAAQTEARFDQIDAKASTYLAVFTVLLGGAGYFVKWVADQLLPPRDPLQWLLTIRATSLGSQLRTGWLGRRTSEMQDKRPRRAVRGSRRDAPAAAG